MKSGGFLNLKKELVTGMGLDWGGGYGDMMHFDMRNRGVGRKVNQARLGYEREKEKEAEAEYEKQHAKE